MAAGQSRSTNESDLSTRGTRPPGSLVGREHEVEQVVELLSTSRLVTLTGAPGVGKSRVAAEVVNQLDGRVVVLLDNCDQELDACAEAARRLVGQGLRVLATAREPLGAGSETVWRIPPLSVSEAARLFCDRARLADPNFVASPENAPAIMEICRRLDGLPLAIELAARRVTAYSLAEIIARLDDPFALLTEGVHAAHPRHHSAWSSLAWSYDRLSGNEQVVFNRLAVFAGRFGEQAACAVCADGKATKGEVSTILRGLVNKSLVEADTGPGQTRYRLLGLMWQFAADKLVAAGEDDALRATHAGWCARAVEAAGDPRRGQPWLERVEPYHDEIRAAIDWALVNDQADTAVMLGEVAAQLCWVRDQCEEARRHKKRVATLVPNASAARQAQALSGAGLADVMAGRLSGAVSQLEEAVAVAERAGLAVDAARARQDLGFVQILAGGGLPALSSMQTTLAQARASADPSVVVDALAVLGRAHLRLGDPALAKQELAESLALARTSGDQDGEAQALIALGEADVVLGHYDEADATLCSGLELALALGELHAGAVAQAALGESARLRGGMAAARRWFVQAADMARKADHHFPLALALLGRGRIELDHEDTAAARTTFQEALTAARACSAAYLVAPCLCALAQVDVAGATAPSLLEALTVARRCGDKGGEALVFEQFARRSEAEGDVRLATGGHRHALAMWAAVGDPAAMARSLEALASLAITEGDLRVPARLLGAAESLRERHGCVRPPSLAQEHSTAVELVRQGLGLEAFGAEWSQGRALTPGDVAAYAARPRGRRLPRRASGWQALTAAERSVAELVVEGRTDSDIASELGVAVTTVKAHLRAVCAKVGVSNRTALTAAFHRRDD